MKQDNVNCIIGTPDRSKSNNVCHNGMIKEYHTRQTDKTVESFAVELDNLESRKPCVVPKLSYEVEVSNSDVMGNIKSIVGPFLNPKRGRKLSKLVYWASEELTH